MKRIDLAVPGVDALEKQLGGDAERVAVPADIASGGCVPVRPLVLPVLPDGPRARPLVLNGSNDLHFLSWAILAQWIEPLGVPYDLVQIDAHDDAQALAPDPRRALSGIHCGSWISAAFRDAPHLRRAHAFALAASMTSPIEAWLGAAPLQSDRLDLYPMGRDWQVLSDLDSLGGALDAASVQPDLLSLARGSHARILHLRDAVEGLRRLDARTDARAVYISIDLDVMRPGLARTRWPGGELTREGLEQLIRGAAKGRLVLGADVCGLDADGARDSASVETVRRALAVLSQVMASSPEVAP